MHHLISESGTLEFFSIVKYTLIVQFIAVQASLVRIMQCYGCYEQLMTHYEAASDRRAEGG